MYWEIKASRQRAIRITVISLSVLAPCVSRNVVSAQLQSPHRFLEAEGLRTNPTLGVLTPTPQRQAAISFAASIRETGRGVAVVRPSFERVARPILLPIPAPI
jgi:hypothetical protein